MFVLRATFRFRLPHALEKQCFGTIVGLDIKENPLRKKPHRGFSLLPTIAGALALMRKYYAVRNLWFLYGYPAILSEQKNQVKLTRFFLESIAGAGFEKYWKEDALVFETVELSE